MHPLIEKYGKEAVEELLDLVLISKRAPSPVWNKFVKKHGFLDEKSRATVYGSVQETTKRFHYINGQGLAPLEEPYIIYNVVVKNGRSQVIFNASIKSIDIEELKGEIY